ncbi:MAG: hypothetical protein IJM88_06780 [Bacteroidales bacterium]|nr:hypothetical protein [Bacteroidales bacterium]
MKKVFLALAVVAMFSFVACGNNGEAAVEDTTPVAEVVEEAAADVEAAAEEVVAEGEAAVEEAVAE